MSRDKRFVLLTGTGIEHRYMARRLAAAVPLEAIVVDTAIRAPSLKRAFRGGRRQGLSRLLHFAYRRVTRDRDARARALTRVLATSAETPFPEGVPVVEVEGINGTAAMDAVRDLAPDAILVFGTAIVGDPMLALARDLAFNVHTGLSPEYRGTDCAFWPLVNGEPGQVGATVHECTSAVDGGRVFGRERTAPVRGDGVHEVFARAVIMAADAYAGALDRYLAGTLGGEPQDLSVGREYRGYMRTTWPELRARWTLRR
jgi:folate-dependent phosphoribosylglycinamide formyltransferase PurN